MELTNEEKIETLKLFYSLTLLVYPKFLQLFLDNRESLGIKYKQGEETLMCNDFGNFVQGCLSYMNSNKQKR